MLAALPNRERWVSVVVVWHRAAEPGVPAAWSAFSVGHGPHEIFEIHDGFQMVDVVSRRTRTAGVHPVSDATARVTLSHSDSFSDRPSVLAGIRGRSLCVRATLYTSPPLIPVRTIDLER